MGKSTANSIIAVVDALGGSAKFRQRYEITSQTLWNWRNAGRFPPTFHARMTADLAEVEFTADPALWGQKATEAAE